MAGQQTGLLTFQRTRRLDTPCELPEDMQKSTPATPDDVLEESDLTYRRPVVSTAAGQLQLWMTLRSGKIECGFHLEVILRDSTQLSSFLEKMRSAAGTLQPLSEKQPGALQSADTVILNQANWECSRQRTGWQYRNSLAACHEPGLSC